MPEIPFGRRGMIDYGARHTALAAQTFMLAASAFGLDTCPMEGIDPRRVARIVGLPKHMSVVMIVPVGFAAKPANFSPRFPPVEVFHCNRFGEAMSGIKPVRSS